MPRQAQHPQALQLYRPVPAHPHWSRRCLHPLHLRRALPRNWRAFVVAWRPLRRRPLHPQCALHIERGRYAVPTRGRKSDTGTVSGAASAATPLPTVTTRADCPAQRPLYDRGQPQRPATRAALVATLAAPLRPSCPQKAPCTPLRRREAAHFGAPPLRGAVMSPSSCPLSVRTASLSALEHAGWRWLGIPHTIVPQQLPLSR